MHPPPERLAEAQDPDTLAHIARCQTCRTVIAVLGRIRTDPSPSRTRLTGPAVTALWFAALLAGLFTPLPSPDKPEAGGTSARVDFENPAGYVLLKGALRRVRMDGRWITLAEGSHPSDGWSAVSIRLTEPVTVGSDCSLRADLMTGSGTLLAALFPTNKDPALIPLHVTPGRFGTVQARFRAAALGLEPGDRIEHLVLAAGPNAGGTAPGILVRSVRLTSDH